METVTWEKASSKFKIILLNMTQEQICNFIWCYDQYVKEIDAFRDEEEDFSISPANIEQFYHQVYKGNMELE